MRTRFDWLALPAPLLLLVLPGAASGVKARPG